MNESNNARDNGRNKRRLATALSAAALLAAGVAFAPSASAGGNVAVSIGVPGLSVGYSNRGFGYVAAAPVPYYGAPYYSAPYVAPVVTYSAPVVYAPYYRPHVRPYAPYYRGRVAYYGHYR